MMIPTSVASTTSLLSITAFSQTMESPSDQGQTLLTQEPEWLVEDGGGRVGLVVVLVHVVPVPMARPRVCRLVQPAVLDSTEFETSVAVPPKSCTFMPSSVG